MNMKQKPVNPVGDAENKGKKKGKVIALVVVCLLVGLCVIFSDQVRAVFNPVSIVGNGLNSDLKSTDGRTNILLLGSDQRSIEANAETGRNELTDTILVASIGEFDKNVVLISVPRDLWVEAYPGYPSKVNAVYGYYGAATMQDVIEGFLGIPIHYYAVVNFELFRDAIDILGGVEVTIDQEFTDYWYPVEGMENAVNMADRYETVRFEAGTQVLDGDTALKFVRSRKGDNGEGTDFARSKRQQKVIMAIKDKFLSLETLVNPKKLKELYDLYATRVDTDVDFSTIQQFYVLSQQIDFAGLRTVVLDDRSAAESGGLLYAPEDTSLYKGAYVLIPRVGDFSQVHAYVQKYLYEQ